jgi:hypothetical protein
MYNVTGLRERHKEMNQFKNLRPSGNFKYTFFDAKELPSGTFYFRPMPSDPRKNPSPIGIMTVSTSNIEVADSKDEKNYFLRAEAYDMPNADAEYATGIVDSILHAITDGETRGLINRATWADNLTRAIGKLSPWVRYQVPSLWFMAQSEYQKVDEKTGKSKAAFNYAPAGLDCMPVAKIWDPTQESVLDTYFSIIEGLMNPPEELVRTGQARPQPPPCDRYAGRLLKLTKAGTKYQLEAIPNPSPLPEILVNEFLGDALPPLATWRDKNRRTSQQVISWLMTSWFKPELEAMGIQFVIPTREPGPAPNVSLGSSMLGGSAEPQPAAAPQVFSPTQEQVSQSLQAAPTGPALGANLFSLGG